MTADAAPDRPRVLGIHAHPDDLEIQCGGTLARLADLGCPVTMVTLAAGDLGSASLSREEIAAVRRKEAAAGAARVGAEHYECLGLPDLSITHDDATRRLVCAAVRRARPALVLTAPPADYMSDHEITSRLVRDACFSAAVPLYECGEPPTGKVPHLYYCDPVGHTTPLGDPWVPGVVVDISGEIDRKLAALACHATQRDWLRVQHGVDEYLDSTRRWSAARGALIGVEYGEGFRQHRGHPHPHDDLLGELLGARRVSAA